MITRPLVQSIASALASKHLVLPANFAYLTIPAGKVQSKAGCDSGKGSALHVAAQEIWNELIGERLKGKLGSEYTVCANLSLRNDRGS
jgi:hypothetical protein